jgi:hypothetical protein
MAQVAGVCIFCGGRPLTKEHVLSDWLKLFIRTEMANYNSREASIGADGVKTSSRIRSGHPSSRRVRCVCECCNTGWMKGIVDASKPLVLRLIQGDSFRLTAEDQELLSAWITTAVIVSEFEDRDLVTIPDIDRQWLWKKRTAPPSWKIWLGDYERCKWTPQWIHNRFSVTGRDEPAPPKGAEGPMNTQTTTYVAGRLYVHVLSSAVSGGALDWRFRDHHDRHVLRQIWPATGYSLLWPPPTMNDRDADRIAGALMQFSLSFLGLPRVEQLVPDL